MQDIKAVTAGGRHQGTKQLHIYQDTRIPATHENALDIRAYLYKNSYKLIFRDTRVCCVPLTTAFHTGASRLS